MDEIDGTDDRLLFRPIRLYGRSWARDRGDGWEAQHAMGRGGSTDLSGEVEVAVEQLQRGHEEEDEDSRQGHGRRRRRSEAEPVSPASGRR
jgi:hypothetical protein